MNSDLFSYGTLSKAATVLTIIGLFSVLYKENKFYRFFEHIFLGLASGWAIVTMWVEVGKPLWWDKMVGVIPEAVTGGTAQTEPGQWLYIFLLPFGLMGYLVFDKKLNWMSRIPIGIILGSFAGQQISVWFNTYGPQINKAMVPILPTTFQSLMRPDTNGLTKDQIDAITATVYPSQALNNVLSVITLLSVLSYFLFSFDIKNKFIKGFNLTGRYLLMVGFGAIFGTTVLMRFTLLIDRMYFVWIEFFQKTLFHR